MLIKAKQNSNEEYLRRSGYNLVNPRILPLLLTEALYRFPHEFPGPLASLDRSRVTIYETSDCTICFVLTFEFRLHQFIQHLIQYLI